MSTSSTPTFGNDLIIGTAAPDSINGLQGNDIISGQEGDDSLIGAEGADSLYGGSGNDQLFGGGSSDTAIVASSPIPFPGDLADSIEGGSGDDILRGNAGNDTLRGGDGYDNLRGDYGDDLIDGGDGIDFVSYYYQPLGLTSGLRFDASNIGTGSSGSVTFSDLIGGTDTLISIERVIFTGTDFADTVTGAQNADQLSGEGGDDSINGGPGNDLLVGGFGNDTLSGSYGDDRIDGGEGMDTATYMSRRENYTLSRASDGNWTVSFSGPIIAIFPAPPTEGADTLINVEKVQFADTVVNLADIPSVVPTVQFTTTASSANEGNSGSTTFTVQAALSAPSTQAVTVPISYSGTATSGTDYTNATLNITIPAGQTTGAATFSVVGDTNVEPNETVVLTMGTPTNASLGINTTYTHTIVDDDPTTTQAPTGAFLRQAGHVVLDSQFVNVYGASALEVVVLGTDAANVAIDQNVERIHLPLDFQLYGYVQTGNLLNVYPARGGSVVMSVVVQNDSDGTVLVFPNGAISTKLTPISPTSPVPGIALGGLSISTSVDRPTVVDPLPAFVINLLPPPIPTPPQRPSDTSVFMGRDALFKAAVNGLRVYGSLGSETLAMANGVSAVVADQNIEAVRFEQRLSSYSFQQTGNVLNIHERASGVKLLEIPLQADADGTQLSFAGRSFAAKISTGVMRLGDKAVAQERPTPIESSVVVSVDRGGSFNADTDDVRFEFVAGTYNYSIAGFSAADQLVFPQGAVPSVSNTSYTDGRVNLGWALGGQTIAVTVTGLTTGQDAALNSTGDFNTVFGAGTVS